MDYSKRKSSIELLKIISMFLICMSHVVNPLLDTVSNGFSLEINNILYTLAKSAGWLGDYIFIACSAYFLVGNKKINIRKIILYYLDVALLFLTYLGICLLCNVNVEQEIITQTLNTTIIKDYWFIRVYLQFLFLLPLFTITINWLSQKLHHIMCYVSLGIVTIHYILYHLDIVRPMYRIFIFLIMVIIMSYGKKYGKFLFLEEKNKKGIVITLILSLVYWIGKIIIVNYIGLNSEIFITDSINICPIYSPIYYIIALSAFLLFNNINIKQSKFINFISSLSLIFYVGHHNKFTNYIPIFENLYNCVISSSPIFSFLILLAFTILRFVYGIIVSIIFKLTIHKILILITNIGKKNTEQTPVINKT